MKSVTKFILSVLFISIISLIAFSDPVSAVFYREPRQLTFGQNIPEINIQIEQTPEPELDYKTLRLIEMAELLKGTVAEPHTEMLLAMLLREDGTLTAERRHDCVNGICFAMGIQGHHICYRGTPLVSQHHGKEKKRYCGWKNGKSAQERFEAEYPGFATNWRIQFAEYKFRMVNCLQDGYSINSCIQVWNSREVGRIGKVRNLTHIVRAALKNI